MKTHVIYPSIDQFRNVIKTLNQAVCVGVDDDGTKIYDRTLTKPKVTFKGTVKLHGSNAAVAFCLGEMWAQSRTQIITPEQDNAGFARFVEDRKNAFENLLNQSTWSHLMTDIDDIIIFFGEWAGGNIQKGVAISNLPKSFFIFDVCIADSEGKIHTYVDIIPFRDIENSIYNIEDYKTWEIEIDFENPGLSQNKLIDITLAVEDECPVGKAFGFEGVGEGVVWKALHNGERQIFKVKGEKHSVSKVKVLASVDVEKLNGINGFIDYAVTENRLDQAIDTICKNSLDIQKMGDIIRWVMNDVIKEESDTLESNGLTAKEVTSKIAEKVRKMVNLRLDKQSGL